MHRNMSFCTAKNKFRINAIDQLLAEQSTQRNQIIRGGRGPQAFGFGTDFIAILVADSPRSFACSAPKNVTPVPVRPARPVRPMRWT